MIKYIVIAVIIAAAIFGVLSFNDGKVVLDTDKGTSVLEDGADFVKDKID